MCSQCIPGGQLFGDLACQRSIQPALAVDRSELFQFALRVIAKFAPFQRQVGTLGVRLRLHRHIFAGSHRHRAGDQAGDAGGKHVRCGRTAAGHADQQAGHREDAVIGAKHGGTQPASVVAAMAFVMDGSHCACSRWTRRQLNRARRSKRGCVLFSPASVW
ncbi:hypothetical protein ST27_01665 [Xanthomonas phaseoli pv. phaseoli]|nr:hypothetical protein ST27_01665 [Xanthomonas phaseoli pv. phaseoli]